MKLFESAARRSQKADRFPRVIEPKSSLLLMRQTSIVFVVGVVLDDLCVWRLVGKARYVGNVSEKANKSRLSQAPEDEIVGEQPQARLTHQLFSPRRIADVAAPGHYCGRRRQPAQETAFVNVSHRTRTRAGPYELVFANSPRFVTNPASLAVIR